MKKIYQGIEATLTLFQTEEVLLASTPVGDGENYIGGLTGVGNMVD